MRAAAGELDLLGDLTAREKLALLVAEAIEDEHEALLCSRRSNDAAVRAGAAGISTREAAQQASNANHVAERAHVLLRSIRDRLARARAIAPASGDDVAALVVEQIKLAEDAAEIAAREAHGSAAAAAATAARVSRQALEAFPPQRSGK